MPRYEFSDGKSNKFWEIALDGRSFTTIYGRLGSAGQSTTKKFGSPGEAAREHDKLVAEKVRKGYELVSGKAKAAKGARKGTAKPGPKRNEPEDPGGGGDGDVYAPDDDGGYDADGS